MGWDAAAENWVKLVCNSAGKLIIDPTEILEDNPTDQEVGKAPTSNWAYDRPLKVKIVNIGVWDMDTNGSVSVAHGLDATKIRRVTAVIINDDATLYSQFSSYTGTTVNQTAWDSTNIILTRFSPTGYDATTYNDGTMNRGYIVIEYID